MITAATGPAPDSQNIALKTKEEFLKSRNPRGKFHDPKSYDQGLEELNRDYKRRGIGEISYGHDQLLVEETSDGLFLNHRQRGPVAYLYDTILYHIHGFNPGRLADRYWSEEWTSSDNDWVNFAFSRSVKVKYLAEVVEAKSSQGRRMRRKYPRVLQRLKRKKQEFELRQGAEDQPLGMNLAILNGKGEVVAVAQNEWGATLVIVAREYRGMGLGQYITEKWYEMNPQNESGGFTPQGYNNAIRVWEKAVRDLLARGWYSQLVRDGSLTQEKAQDIISGLSDSKVQRSNIPEPSQEEVAKAKPLILVDDNISFVLYDARVYEGSVDDVYDGKYVYGYGFLRDSGDKTFIFSLDYDRPYARLATAIIMQMARDEGEDLYDGEGYHDLVEFDLLPGGSWERDGDLVRLKEDLLDLEGAAIIERNIRNANDKYGMYRTSLLETANSKW